MTSSNPVAASSRTIGPYRLDGTTTEIATHEGARFVGADLLDELVVWAEFDPSAAPCVRTVVVVRSGDPVPAEASYVATVIGRDGWTANHVYDATLPNPLS